MKRALVWLIVLAALGLGGKFALETLFSSGEVHAARERVRLTLEGMKPSGDLNLSISMWSQGIKLFQGGPDAFDAAANEFESWARRKRVLKVSEFEVLDAVIEKETGHLGRAVVLVTAGINGKQYRMRVMKGVAIEWVEG